MHGEAVGQSAATRRATRSCRPPRKPAEQSRCPTTGGRIIALDTVTLAVLESWRKRPIAERLEWGSAWIQSGRIFTQEDGRELRPADVTDHFYHLVADAGLPPIRLHDLRHGAATIALEAGVDIKVVQEDLGHSTSVLTRDTYTSVSPRLARESAEKTAAAIPRAASA